MGGGGFAGVSRASTERSRGCSSTGRPSRFHSTRWRARTGSTTSHPPTSRGPNAERPAQRGGGQLMLGLKREIDQVAKDKGLDSKEIIAALEEAMRQAAKRERGLETEIDARFNEELGEIELFEFREVVEEVTDKT